MLRGAALSGNVFQFGFTNATGASFSILATTNLTTPVTNWTVVGHAVESPAGSGSYQVHRFGADEIRSNLYILRQP